MSSPQPLVGVVERFEPGEHARVERVLEGLQELGITCLRTDLSAAGSYAPGVAEWYDWLLPRLAADVEVLPCVTITQHDDTGFLDVILTRYGASFGRVELWSEPASRSSWEPTLAADWRGWCETLRAAADAARRRGFGVVLGGLSVTDATRIHLLVERGVLHHADVVGVRGLPEASEAGWKGWSPQIADVRSELEAAGCRADVWITEVGCSTVRHRDFAQVQALVEVLRAGVPRLYWYAAEDLEPERLAGRRDGEDEREYHFGLRRADGSPKLLCRLWRDGGLAAVHDAARLRKPRRAGGEPVALITGGAGFVGTNLAHALAEDGQRVRVLDNLSRPGVERNLRWLRGRHEALIDTEIADVRDRVAVRRALEGVDQVYHFAAQVAVTTSLDDPLDDYGVNLGGTITLLEELRRLADPPPLVFTSTNKVYGDLPRLPLERDGDRWEPCDAELRARGLDESLPLDFCTPYGCSKGGADQYVLDYAKSYGLPATVFRMSCIYGPHQHGTEDQGWVAHFLLRTLARKPITVYGDGAQVRDVLWVEDLVDALLRLRDTIDDLAGTAFNVGGGPENAVSLLELIELIGELHGRRPRVEIAPARAGDQRYYVADTTRLRRATDWRPRVGVTDGIEELYAWLRSRTGRRRAALPAVTG